MSISPGNFRNHRACPDDIDEIAVDRAVGGEEIRLSPPEGALAVAELHRRGLNDQEIAARLHITDRTVVRIRKRLSLPSNVASGRKPTHHEGVA